MKNKISRERSIYGAAFLLTLSGPAKELQREVARLRNFGVITGVPDDFNEGEDTSVVVNSYPTAFDKGANAIAANKARAVCEARNLRGKGSLVKLRDFYREHFTGTFKEGQQVYSSAAPRPAFEIARTCRSDS